MSLRSERRESKKQEKKRKDKVRSLMVIKSREPRFNRDPYLSAVQISELSIEEMEIWDIKELDHRMKLEEADLLRVLSTYSDTISEAAPLDATWESRIGDKRPAKLYGDGSDSWWDKWLTFTPPAGARRKPQRR